MDVGFFFLAREKHAPKKEAKPRTNGNAFCGHVAVAVDIHFICEMFIYTTDFYNYLSLSIIIYGISKLHLEGIEK
jgi:hypothetical protein